MENFAKKFFFEIEKKLQNTWLHRRTNFNAFYLLNVVPASYRYIEYLHTYLLCENNSVVI